MSTTNPGVFTERQNRATGMSIDNASAAENQRIGITASRAQMPTRGSGEALGVGIAATTGASCRDSAVRRTAAGREIPVIDFPVLVRAAGFSSAAVRFPFTAGSLSAAIYRILGEIDKTIEAAVVLPITIVKLLLPRFAVLS